ncbi:DUF6599 family protein [Bacteroidota bacterium]
MEKRIFSLLVLTITSLTLVLASGKGDVSFPKQKGWKLKVSSDVYLPDNLWDLINGAAESYLSYDFMDLHLADYEKGDVLIHVEIYRHSNSNNAFGIYSSERSPDYNFLKLGTQGYLDEGVLNFFTGQFYVKLYSTGSGEELQNSLKEIGRIVSSHLNQVGDWPSLISAFPEGGKLENRENFIGENFIGFNFLHSAFTAEYEGDYKLFIIDGGNREKILNMVREYLEFTNQDIDPEKESSFVIKDRYNGDIPVVLKGSFMAGILDGSGKEDAIDNLKTLVNKLTD